MRSKAVQLCLYTFVMLCFSGCTYQERPPLDLPAEIIEVVETDMADTHPTAEDVFFQDYQRLEDIFIVALTYRDKENKENLYPDRFCFYILTRQANEVAIIYKTDNSYPVDKDVYPMCARGFELAIVGYPFVLSVDSFCINDPKIQTLHLYDWDGSMKEHAVNDNQRLLFYSQWNNGEHLERIEAFDEDGATVMIHYNLQPASDFEIPTINLPTEE